MDKLNGSLTKNAPFAESETWKDLVVKISFIFLKNKESFENYDFQDPKSAVAKVNSRKSKQ